MTQLENIITADEGKVFRRILDQTIYGREIILGYTYYIGGLKLAEPHLDVPGDFEEIDDPGDVITVVKPESPTLEDCKRDVRVSIYQYDVSDAVNQFFINGEPCWIDKATRVGLVNSTNMEITLGRTESTLILGEMVLTLPCQTILGMLAQLEVYAKDCYNVTAQHIIQVNALETIEEVVNFDITAGYPAKLNF